jgi:carbon storage regulator
MLVLSRKKLESIVIDEQIVITVVEIRGDKVRIGIEAPRDISIKRCELEARSSTSPAPNEPPEIMSDPAFPKLPLAHNSVTSANNDAPASSLSRGDATP